MKYLDVKAKNKSGVVNLKSKKIKRVKREKKPSNFNIFNNKRLLSKDEDLFLVRKKRRKKGWRMAVWILIILNALIVLAVAGFFLKAKYFPDFGKNKSEDVKEEKISESPSGAVQSENIPPYEYLGEGGESFKEKSVLFSYWENGKFKVYRRNIGEKTQEMIFDFTNANKDERNFSLSKSGEYLAYADDGGIKTYSIKDGGVTDLISRNEFEESTKLGSILGLNDEFSIYDVSWSSTGKFIAVDYFSDDMKCGLINIENKSLAPLQDGEKQLECINLKWSSDDKFFIKPAFLAYSNPGLFLSGADELANALDIASKFDGGKNDYYEADISPDGTQIVFLYDNNYEENNSNFIGIADRDGNNFRVLDSEFEKSSVVYLPSGQEFLFSEERDGASYLMRYKLEENRKEQIMVLPGGYNLWKEVSLTGEGDLMIVGYETDESEESEEMQNKKSSRIFVIDFVGGKVKYASQIFESDMDFVGVINN